VSNLPPDPAVFSRPEISEKIPRKFSYFSERYGNIVDSQIERSIGPNVYRLGVFHIVAE
jgi:hypothetical protein